MRILIILLIILSSSCHTYFETVYDLDTSQDRLFYARDFQSCWDLCLSNKSKKEYDDIADSMSSPSSEYYRFYKYLNDLPCIEINKMKGKDLFVFFTNKSIDLIE